MTYINKTGVNFEKIYDSWVRYHKDDVDPSMRVVYFVDLSEPFTLEGQKILDKGKEVALSVDAYWPNYTHVYRDSSGVWYEIRKIGGKMSGTELEFIGLEPWKYDHPSDEEVREWKEERERANRKKYLLTAEGAALLFQDIIWLARDVSSGLHGNHQNSSLLYDDICKPIFEAAFNIDWTDVESMKKFRSNVENVAKGYPNIINKYLVIWSFLKY